MRMARKEMRERRCGSTALKEFRKRKRDRDAALLRVHAGAIEERFPATAGKPSGGG
jgi:hypothetical protein